MKRFVFAVIAVLLALTPVLSAGAAPAAQEEMMVYTVQSGDTLTGISKTYLGRATAYMEIVEATNTSTEPGIAMIEDPNVIVAGWKIVIPTPEIIPEMPVGEKGTMVVAMSGDFVDWDPATVSFWIALEVVGNTYDNLVQYGYTTNAEGQLVFDSDKLEPMLAESWETSPDGLTTTFQIRKGATFHNGDVVNAQAAKKALDRYLEVPGTAGFLLREMALVSDTNQIEVIDDYALAIHTPQPSPLLLRILTIEGPVICNVDEIMKHATADDPYGHEWAKNNVAGSGPYKIGSWEPGVQLVLEANEDYWAGAPALKKIIYHVVPSPEDRLLLLRNGDVDVIYELPLKDVPALSEAPGIKVISIDTVGNMYLHMINTIPPFDNKALREAILYAIPYDRIIEEANYGLARPLTAPIPKGVPYHLEGVWPYKYDVEMAKQKLAEAGYPGGEGLEPLDFAMKTGVPEEEATSVYIQAALAEIGITMNINKMSMAAHSEQRDKHTLPFTYVYFIPWVPEPQYHLFWNFLTGSVLNYSEYSNPQVDDILETLARTLDPATRKALCEEAQQIISADAPQGLLYQPTWNWASRDVVMGYKFRPGNMTHWFGMWKE